MAGLEQRPYICKALNALTDDFHRGLTDCWDRAVAESTFGLS